MPLLARFARPGEWVFATCVLVWLGEAYGPFHKPLQHRNLVNALLMLSLLLLVRQRRELRSLLAAGWPVLLPVLVAALSPGWSIDTRRSLHAAVALAAYTAFGLWLALRFGVAEQHRLVASVLALITVGSALMVLVAPELGVMREVHPGAWNGLYHHKNSLASYLALAVLGCGLLALAERPARGWAGSVAALALAMLVPARSVGGAAALVLAAVPVGLAAGLRRLARPARVRASIFVASALALVVALALAEAPALLALLGRDVTLTRRTEIWALLVRPLGEHIWFGHGADAFWHVASASRDVVSSLHFDPGSAHDGFLDLALELGVVGLAAFFVPFAVASARAARLALEEPGAGALWPLAFLAWCVTSNLPESAFMLRGPLGWAVFIATAATLATRRAARSRPGVN